MCRTDEANSEQNDACHLVVRMADGSGDVFLLDSGASDHLGTRLDWLQDCRSIETRGIVLNGGKRGLPLIAEHWYYGQLSVQVLNIMSGL